MNCLGIFGRLLKLVRDLVQQRRDLALGSESKIDLAKLLTKL